MGGEEKTCRSGKRGGSQQSAGQADVWVRLRRGSRRKGGADKMMQHGPQPTGQTGTREKEGHRQSSPFAAIIGERRAQARAHRAVEGSRYRTKGSGKKKGGQNSPPTKRET